MSHGICPKCRQAEDECTCKAVCHPTHYTSHPSGLECIQVTEHMGFLDGNAIKYIWRHKDKGKQIEDLEKAKWYIDRLISLYKSGDYSF